MGIFIVEYDLKSKSPTTVEDGDVIVDKGYSTVVVRNIEADSHEDAREKAEPRAQAFLNELCWRYGIVLELGNGSTSAIQEDITIRHLHRTHVKILLKGGHRPKFPKTLKQVTIQPSDAKSLYRKAMISKDPRDKFRELFLVVENIATKIVPSWKKKTMRHLLTSAIKKCFTFRLNELEDFTKSYHFKYEGDIIKAIVSNLIENYRTYLFHAKSTMNKYIPFNEEDEWKVRRILPLVEFLAKSLISYEDDNLLS
jgi:hypothetical protein